MKPPSTSGASTRPPLAHASPPSRSRVARVTARVASLTLGLLLAANHAAAGYPTIWTVRNDTGEPWSVRCIGVSTGQLGAFDFDSPWLAAGGAYRHAWPNYNEALGLEGAQYTCAVGDAAGVYTGTRTRFDAGWGENVDLRIVMRDGRPRVERIVARP